MGTIIPRRARHVHAGDIVLNDPDHQDRPVAWRVTRPAKLTRTGHAIVDYRDLNSGAAGIAHFDALTELLTMVGGTA